VIRLADLTWPEARRVARDARSVVLLPLGAVEQHGPHLPLSVDWLGAEELARRVAPHLRRAGWRPVLAPSLPYGTSTLAATWAGTVSLSIATTRRLIVEVVRGLATHGFRRFVLANYQADPDHLRAIAGARRPLERARLQVLVAGFAPAGRRPDPMTDPRVRALMRSPPAGMRVALGRGGDGHDAVGGSVARAASGGPPSAAGVGGLGGRTGAGRAPVRAHATGRPRLLRLAGRRAGADRAASDGATRPAHRGGAAGGSRGLAAERGQAPAALRRAPRDGRPARRATGARRKQSSVWSLTRPTACMKA